MTGNLNFGEFITAKHMERGISLCRMAEQLENTATYPK